jgi:protein SCO1
MKTTLNSLVRFFLKWQMFALLLGTTVLVACGGGSPQAESVQDDVAQESTVLESADQEEESAAVRDVVIGDEDSPFNGVVLEGDNLAFPIVAQSDEGVQFDMSELRGEYVLVNFGYTFCPDICPLTLGTLARAYEELSESQKQNVNVVFITLDPERDVPERLNAYLEAFNEDFIGLYIPEKGKLEAVKAAYGVFSEIRKLEGDESKKYFIDHTGGVYVVGPEGTFKLFFPHDATSQDVQDDLTMLLQDQ